MFIHTVFFWFLIVGSVVFPIIGFNMGKQRTIGALKGALLGFVLGFAGLLIILLYPTVEEEVIRYFSVADEIEKYKRLLDNGAITWDEYRWKKNELLKQ